MGIENLNELGVLSDDGETAPTDELESEKVRRLFGHCFEISKFQEGDLIPVGGESIFSNDSDIRVVGDFENMKEVLNEAHELATKYNLVELKKWLDSQSFEIDERLFASLYAFTTICSEKYPNNPNREESRKKLYFESDGEIRISDVFAANVAECAEIAALAQKYLQLEGIQSTYFSGDVLWSKKEEFSEQHSFIIIQNGDKTYIYDPMNPLSTTEGKFPSIYTTEAEFNDEMSKMQKRFVTAKNLLSKSEAYYGTNDGTNVDSERNIV